MSSQASVTADAAVPPAADVTGQSQATTIADDGEVAMAAADTEEIDQVTVMQPPAQTQGATGSGPLPADSIDENLQQLTTAEAIQGVVHKVPSSNASSSGQ